MISKLFFVLNLALVIANGSMSPVSPDDTTPKKLLRGQAAVNYLNARLSTQSNIGKISISKLKEHLLKNADLALDTRSNRPLYTCKGLLPNKNPVTAQGLPAANSPDPLASSVDKNDQGLPLLSSRPTSKMTILLDFDGCSIPSGHLWNNDTAFDNKFYDPSKNGATFDATEQADIIAIWRAVSEDYAPFDIDVTTIDRGIDRIIWTSEDDDQYGIRVCIGGSWYVLFLSNRIFIE